jgi:hypothetical protein
VALKYILVKLILENLRFVPGPLIKISVNRASDKPIGMRHSPQEEQSSEPQMIESSPDFSATQ